MILKFIPKIGLSFWHVSVIQREASIFKLVIRIIVILILHVDKITIAPLQSGYLLLNLLEKCPSMILLVMTPFLMLLWPPLLVMMAIPLVPQ